LNLTTFSPAQMPELVSFLNRVLAGQRHWAPIGEADFRERVLEQQAFDPAGLMLAWVGDKLVGGVHALKPPPSAPIYEPYEPRYAIAWLAVDQACRGQGIGSALLGAAQDYLYYCPVYFAGHSTPLYGIIEKLWVPWYGSTEHMAISAVSDKAQVEWLTRRGYQVVDPGDVSMQASLHNPERPQDPGLAQRGLRVVGISERSPWRGDEPFYRLRGWNNNGGRQYHGLVVAEGERAVGEVVWYPLPDQETAALAWFGIEQSYRGLRFGSYLLDRARVEMAGRGYLSVEVHVHTRRHPEAFAMFRHRGFQVIDYWVNLVKT
jgi:ribosomal protein S18 acetylase RimI-like enzyme